ncbi:substrate-binding domain-containing protein [Actinosynnema sp. NPDC047251]|uniref:von Willebrand factor type A family protein n=1 Tax=Saccharothrix espanaensis (strain ATCC 51144 / DSM 44229 / JCM 9112 / NBRC 15066 / NRRL 15764) TaxID=1179773 RepID=K0JNS2_SACES|nr:substrate-binding domain-containing protein [Saccharothrix espanaensis]CCH27680.1 von Willebrand factor type A family protein [Saccharothrix espanaensis DSM 44229]
MSARTERPPGRARRTALPIGALIGVLAAAGVTVVAIQATGGPDCKGTLPLKVAVAPATEEVVRGAADDYQAGQPVVEGKCVQVLVEARGAADVAHELPTAQINPPALWIPDSTMWAAESRRQAGDRGADAPRLEIKPSLASSPLVITGSEGAMTALGWPITPVSWARVVDPEVPVVLTDPTTSTEGLATLAVIRAQLGNPDGTPKPELVGALLRIGREAPPSVRDAFGKVVQGADNAPVFTASEQAVLAANRVAGSRRVVGSHPKEGTIGFDFPVVRVSRTGEMAGTAAAAAGFEEALRGGRTAQRFAEAGFRTPDGKAPRGWTTEQDGLRGDDVTLLRTPTPDQVAELLGTWGAISLDTRILAVLDVSGSMAEKMQGSELTRVDAAKEAALTALSMLPDTSEIGLWAFSTNKRPKGYVELVPTGPLGEPIGGAPRRDQLQKGAGAIPAMVGGGTSLNDTVLAAFRNAQQTFNPNKINSVTLLTDGSNDDISTTKLPELLDTLRREVDPARPVPMFMVGLGPDADLDALRQIADATGGKSYQAMKPEDIKTVLLDAISQRRCRPNC